MVQARALAGKRKPERISFEDFLVQYEGVAAEWVDGEVELVSVNNAHSRVNSFLVEVMGVFVRRQELGEIRFDPFVMKTGPDLPGRAPDVLFISNAKLQLLRNMHFDGPGDLVVEIVSRDSRQRDRERKFGEYERGGVAEYWIVDPETRRADFYVLEDGHYRRVAPRADGVYLSRELPGFWIRIDWLWDIPKGDVHTEIEAGPPE
ncbi:MAG: Uma2 family endonuclease [Dehalococcoidia bacterium]